MHRKECALAKQPPTEVTNNPYVEIKLPPKNQTRNSPYKTVNNRDLAFDPIIEGFSLPKKDETFKRVDSYVDSQNSNNNNNTTDINSFPIAPTVMLKSKFSEESTKNE